MTFGKITEEGIAKLRGRIGIARTGSNMHRRGPLRLTAETIRRYALGAGNDDPLHHDRAYAAASRHGGLVGMPSLTGFLEKTNGASDGLPGCHTIWREAEYEWLRPLREDDALDAASRLLRVDLVASRFGGGKAVVQDYETAIVDATGAGVATYRTSWHRFERDSARSASTLKGRELAHYTPADIERIKDDYRKERRRGREVLWWEDVTVGDELPFLVKGPTTQISKFAFESWLGAGGWFVGHRLAFELFEKHPGLPFVNEQGIPEAPVAIHWSNERSQRILGLPGAYEAGYERTAWIVHHLANWMGDDGFLYRLTQRYPTFNLLGDTTWCHGTVEEKSVLAAPVDGKRHAVRCRIWTVNQRGDVTTTGDATVLLRARADG